MRKFEVKSRFSKRLIPLLLVPTLLGSNFISIEAFADAEQSINANADDQSNDVVENSEPEVSEEQPSEEQPSEEQVEDVQESETQEESETTEDQVVNPEGEENSADAESSDAASTEASDDATEASSDASSEASSDDAAEASSDASSEASSDDAAEASSDASSADSSDEKVTISLDDLSFPVELVVKSVEQDSKKVQDVEGKIAVYASTEEGKTQLVEGESVDVKVEVDTDEASSEASDEATEGTEDSFNEEETTDVSFEYSVEDENYEVESVQFNGEDVEYADGYITFDIENSLLLDESGEANVLTINMGHNAREEDGIEITGFKLLDVDNRQVDKENHREFLFGENIGFEFDVTPTGDAIHNATINVKVVADKGYSEEVLLVDGKYTWRPTDDVTLANVKIQAVRLEDGASCEWPEAGSNSLFIEKKSSENVEIPLTSIKAVSSVGENWYSYSELEDWVKERDRYSGALTVTVAGLADAEVRTVTINGKNAQVNGGWNYKFVPYFPFCQRVYSYTATAEADTMSEGLHDTVDVVICGVKGNVMAAGPVKLTNSIKIDSAAPSAAGITVEVFDPKDSKNPIIAFAACVKSFVLGEEEYKVKLTIPGDCDYNGLDDKKTSGLGAVRMYYEICSVTYDKYGNEKIGEKIPCYKDFTIDHNMEAGKYVARASFPVYNKEAIEYIIGDIVIADKVYNSETVVTNTTPNPKSLNKDYNGCYMVIDDTELYIHYIHTADSKDKDDANKAKESTTETGNVTEAGTEVGTETEKNEDDGVTYTYDEFKKEAKPRIFYGHNVTENVEILGYNINDNKEATYTKVNEENITLTAPEGNSERVNKLTGKKEFTINGEYYVNTVAEKKAQKRWIQQNKTFDAHETIVVDKDAPVIEIDLVNNKELKGVDSTYISANSVEIRVKVYEDWPIIKEKEFNGAKRKTEVIVTCTSAKDNSVSTIKTESEDDWKYDKDLNAYVAIIPVTEEGKYEITATASDVIHTPVETGVGKGDDTKGFTLDRTKPTIAVTYDNNDVRNEKYYNKERKATVTITDFTFDESKTSIKLQQTRGTATPTKFVPAGDKVYQATITFAQDGKYSFTVDSTDKAGNAADTRTEAEFVVDTTDPKITVSYTAQKPKNEMYYKEARTATVEIDDMTFDDALVEYKAQEIADGSTLPVLGAFTSSEDLNTAQISFNTDGKYGYIINCTDLAGNTSTTYVSDVFVIDTTVPTLKFSGVENFSANKGKVAPVVAYSDKYMDMDATTLKMVGSNNGPVSLTNEVTKTEEGFVVSYSDFAHDKSVDDLYTLQATVVDLAGNETKEELVFSVNRYGSVFVLSDATKALNERYYINEAEDVTITEINVDTLTYRDVSISRDGDITELKKDRNYQVAKQGSDTSWKTYTYTISKDNFKKDGVYSVTVYTEDRATNVQDNKSRDAEVNFALDSTKPSVVTAGIENDLAVYKADSHNFNLDVTDNMALESVAVYDDGKEIASYDQEALLNSTDAKVVTLAATDDVKSRTITVIAQDVAGNKETVVYNNVIVTKNEKQEQSVLGEKRGGGNGSNGGDGTINGNPTRNILIWCIIGLCAIALVSGAGVLVYKKKG